MNTINNESISIRNAMVLWSPSEWHERYAGRPQIQVVNHIGNNREWNYLLKSMGSCWAGWKTSSPDKLAVNLLSIFTRAVGRDGVPADQAHAEFMKISEYREWIERNEGPFADAYWSWERRDAA